MRTPKVGQSQILHTCVRGLRPLDLPSSCAVLRYMKTLGRKVFQTASTRHTIPRSNYHLLRSLPEWKNPLSPSASPSAFASSGLVCMSKARVIVGGVRSSAAYGVGTCRDPDPIDLRSCCQLVVRDFNKWRARREHPVVALRQVLPTHLNSAYSPHAHTSHRACQHTGNVHCIVVSCSVSPFWFLRFVKHMRAS